MFGLVRLSLCVPERGLECKDGCIPVGLFAASSAASGSAATPPLIAWREHCPRSAEQRGDRERRGRDRGATDMMGKSGRAMLDALVAGTTDPVVPTRPAA